MMKESLVRGTARTSALSCACLMAMVQVGACGRGADPAEEVGEARAGVSGCGEWYLPVAGDRVDACAKSGAGDTASPGDRHVADGLCAAPGAEVVAVADGVVAYASWYKPCESWAHLVLIEHTLADGEHVCSLYGRVQPLATIAVGAPVEGGEPIGNVHRSAGSQDRAQFSLYRGPCPAWATTTCPAHGYLPDSTFAGEHLDPQVFFTEVCPELG